MNFFEVPSRPSATTGGSSVRHNSTVAANTNAASDINSFSNDAAVILKRLANAVSESREQQQHSTSGGARRSNATQEEEVARMGMMLAQMAMNNNSIGNGSEMMSGFQRSLFQPKETHNRHHRPTAHRQSSPSDNQATQQNNLQQQQAWYSLERSLLRELIVLTMRHSNGNLLRYVPSIEDQLHYLNGHSINGHMLGERFAPQSALVSEGVRIVPNLHVVSEWKTDDGDGNDSRSSSHEDLQFRSQLSFPLLGSGARDAISLCGECGWLYGRIALYVEGILEDTLVLDGGVSGGGYQCSVTRALVTRLDMELGEYHNELALLESELPPLNLPADSGIHSSGVSGGARYLTLRSLVARLPPLRERLRTMAILVDGVGARNLRGGKVLASILRHSMDGDTRHSELVRSIGADCSVPWYKLLSQWITQGVLEDAHSEFFVAEVSPEDAGVKGEVGMFSGYFTWHKRYVLVEGQIPLCSGGGMLDIMTVDLARQVLLVGKGINFIRYCLQDRDWEVNGASSSDAEMKDETDGYNFVTLMDLSGNDEDSQCISTLHAAVTQSSKRIHSHILDSLRNKHNLMKHLHALKQFLFLGQGDFVSLFVESLDQEFQGRTSVAGIYSHTLLAVLEGALRTSNARFLPDYVQGHLGVRLMIDENDPDRYWMGDPPKKKSDEMVPWEDNTDSIQDPWDYICLEYTVDSPLDAIVHTSAIETYHQVFLFLFRIKRVEWMLNNSWRQSTALNHAILIETKAGGADAPHIGAAAEQSSFLLRRVSSTRQTMLHFISNLQNYLLFEVLEGGWERLVKSIDRSQTLDDVVSAHDSYLNEIIVKTLLNNNGKDEGDGKDGANNKPSLEDQLQKLLAIALRFGKFQDQIFSNSLSALNKAAKIRRQVEEQSKKGTWGRTTVDEEEGRVFLYLADEKLFRFVENTAKEFDVVFSGLLEMLRKEVYDVDEGADGDSEDAISMLKNHDALQFLLFRLDFSGYYARQKRKRSTK